MTVRDYQNLLKLIDQIEQGYIDKHNEAGKSHNYHEKKYNFYAVSITREIRKEIKNYYLSKLR